MIKYRDSEEMAIKHIDWFLKMIRPILIEHMIHGYKHGYYDALSESNTLGESLQTKHKEVRKI